MGFQDALMPYRTTVVRLTVNEKVAGSNPAMAVIWRNEMKRFFRFLRAIKGFWKIFDGYRYDVHGYGSNGICVKINYYPMCGGKLK